MTLVHKKFLTNNNTITYMCAIPTGFAKKLSGRSWVSNVVHMEEVDVKLYQQQQQDEVDSLRLLNVANFRRGSSDSWVT